ncbi:MAG: sulfite exporter TauE/SafE family protein [Ruminococcus sp.]|uniref:urease accessory protein UreH domain-containing protein n=1 Tax=Ruminococcus sp. TaxID=41978 RepID=UPI001B203D79|nr:sulfite exporter TauE/SafE family protein [Ruminococcus sp.]MBO7475289.1 sulfite exporter TauE/SafE family protein [Ruminococcus sp.]
MGFSLLLESMTAAASVGMGCGTCCGSGISAALYGYLTTHTKNIRQSVRAFIDFFFGKFLAVILLCCTASIIGSSIIDDSGRIFGIKAALIVDAVMLAMGVWLLICWIRERTGKNSCKTCKGCKNDNEELDEGKTHHAALIGMGFSYGISPCAPLILITGYAATLPVAFAAILGAVFSLASTVSPVLFIMLLSGVLAKKMHNEIPQYLTWFRLGCYILVIVVFTSGIIKALL